MCGQPLSSTENGPPGSLCSQLGWLDCPGMLLAPDGGFLSGSLQLWHRRWSARQSTWCSPNHTPAVLVTSFGHSPWIQTEGARAVRGPLPKPMGTARRPLCEARQLEARGRNAAGPPVGSLVTRARGQLTLSQSSHGSCQTSSGASPSIMQT